MLELELKTYLVKVWLNFLQRQGLKISQGDYPVTLIQEKIIVKGNEALDYNDINNRVNSAIDLNRDNFLNYLNNILVDYSNKLQCLENEYIQKSSNYTDNFQMINYLKYNFPTLADFSEQAKVKREIQKLEDDNINLSKYGNLLNSEYKKTQELCSIIKELENMAKVIKPFFTYNHQPHNKVFIVDFK